MTDLLALEKRLGEAGEESRELDWAIAMATGMIRRRVDVGKYSGKPTAIYHARNKRGGWSLLGQTFDLEKDPSFGPSSTHNYTTSLDAALALAEHKLTECGKSHADILNWILEAMEEVGSGNIVSAFALAVCLALVRAIAHNPAVEK